MSIYLCNSRSEVNILLCGDPGTSKSQLLQVGIEWKAHSEGQNFRSFLIGYCSTLAYSRRCNTNLHLHLPCAIGTAGSLEDCCLPL